jgi:putative flippase GtrA
MSWLISYLFSFVVFYFVFFRFYEFERKRGSEPWEVVGKVKLPVYAWLIGVCLVLTPIVNIISTIGVLVANIINLCTTYEWNRTLHTFKLPEFLTKKY